VKPVISPARAFAYRPLRSRSSHTASGVATCTSTKFPTSETISRTLVRAAAYGAIGAQMAIPPCRATSVATYPIRAMFRSRSSRENVRPADSSRRTRSPSSSDTVRSPRSSSASRRSRASVDLPEPDSPVKKTTSPRLDLGGRARRSSAVTASGTSQVGTWSPESSIAPSSPSDSSPRSAPGSISASGRQTSDPGS
jgi:hypothetical protein